jgi:hypothetical protein
MESVEFVEGDVSGTLKDSRATLRVCTSRNSRKGIKSVQPRVVMQ